jgi:hypothetical protein
MCTTMLYITDPTSAEAMVAWKLSWVFFFFFFGGDAFKIVNTLRQDGSCWSRYWQLIEDSVVILNGLQS